MKRAALYMRVSTKGHGQTTETQAVALREYASHRGCEDRKSTRLNSSHRTISYAVFCLKKKRNRMPSSALKKKHKNRTRISDRRTNKCEKVTQDNPRSQKDSLTNHDT